MRESFLASGCELSRALFSFVDGGDCADGEDFVWSEDWRCGAFDVVAVCDIRRERVFPPILPLIIGFVWMICLVTPA